MTAEQLFARTGKGRRIHRPDCPVIHPPDDPVRAKWPGAFTLPVSLSRPEALAFLAGAPGRRRCLVCAPDLPEGRA